jgi:hypothetical protein
MSALTNFLENKITDWFWRGQAYTPPATHYFGLLVANRGYSNSIRSTAVALLDICIPATPNGRMYRCTTAGTTGAGEPTWSTVAGGTTADGGTVVWTEMTPDLEAGTNLIEVSTSGTAYARQPLAASLANFAGTQALLSTVASSGTTATTANNAAITYGAPSANWGVVVALGTYDAVTAGNLLTYQFLTAPKTINNLDAAPSIAISAFTSQIDN